MQTSIKIYLSIFGSTAPMGLDRFFRFLIYTLRRPRCRWVDNIKMDLREIGWDGLDWIDLPQDRDQWRALVNAVMNLRAP
jgi:hypothetical protein